MLTIALSGLEHKAFLYVDDIIVFGCSLKNHTINLVKVLDKLQRYNLKLNEGKCCFLKSEMVYLGHLITPNWIKPDPEKFEAIIKFPVLKNSVEVRKFVAFGNYYRCFANDFTEITSCLNFLLKKDKPFIWNKLISPPIFRYPDFGKPFILTTGASNLAFGTVLSEGEIGQDRPIS